MVRTTSWGSCVPTEGLVEVVDGHRSRDQERVVVDACEGVVGQLELAFDLADESSRMSSIVTMPAVPA